MPLGAARLNTIARYVAAGAANEAIYTNYITDSYNNIVLAATMNQESGYTDLSQELKSVSGYSATTQSTYTAGTNTEINTDTTVFADNGYTSAAQFAVNGWTSGNAGVVYTLGTSIPASSSGTFLIEFWAKAMDSTANRNWCISSSDVNGRFLFGINSSSSSSWGNENNIGLGDNNWHHVAISCSSGSKRVHVDGVYKGAWVSSNTGFTNLHVGQFNAGDLYDFDGYIQDLRVYVGTSRVYTSSSTVDNDYWPIVAQYAPAGARDMSAWFRYISGNDFSYTAGGKIGGAIYNSISGTTPSVSSIFLNNGVDLDTLDDTDEWTIEFWWKLNYSTSDMTRRPMIASSTSSYWNYGFPSWNNQIYFMATNSGVVDMYVDGTGQSKTGIAGYTWYHCAIVCDGSQNVKWYHDGTLQKTWTGVTNSAMDEWCIGIGWGGTASVTSSMYNYFDEVRISQTQRYTSNFTPSTTAFVDDADTLALFHMSSNDPTDDCDGGV